MEEPVISLKPKLKAGHITLGHSLLINFLKVEVYVNLTIIQDQEDSANSQLWQPPFPIGRNLWQSHLGYPIFSWLPIIRKPCILVAVIQGWMGWLI